ncbi:hypothetical protein [Nonomuraea fuscirosea]|uniref:hypothetical protein n=1 Tax=Nonomuraea fuscirosea TaxID=1291556 RepID=UPI0033EFDA72
MENKSTSQSNRVRAEREVRGWSQSDLARELIRAAANDERRPTRLPSLESVKKNIRGWENEKHDVSPFYRRLCALVFDVAESDLFGGAGYDALRHSLDDVLMSGAMSDASLEDWERTVMWYGRAAHLRPAAQLIHDLGADLTDLKHALAAYRSAMTVRRLTRVAAHMAGLMCLTFIKLDDRQAFRCWARTARSAAREAGDPRTQSWVLAQEAYGHFYAHDFLDAVEIAQQAQKVAHTCVGAVLAAALEARAHAAFGLVKRRETEAALRKAEDLLAALGSEEINDSAFGYNEAQLLFHRGNAYTHLGDSAAAWQAQQRALELYSEHDYLDRSLTRLDRTLCLARDGDSSGALEYATATLMPLTDDQRSGIITLRGREVLTAIPNQQRALPVVRQLRELLTPDN